MTAPVRVRVSEEEYLATMTDEKPSLEFVNGEVFQKPMTKRDHQDVSKRILEAMLDLEKRTRGYFTWEATTNLSVGDDRRYRVPDLAYWAPGRPASQPNEVYLPPTLAIEVPPDGQSMNELRAKCQEYLSHGIEECWLFDPIRRTVEVFDESRNGVKIDSEATLTSEKVAGFSVPISDLWAGL